MKKLKAELDVVNEEYSHFILESGDSHMANIERRRTRLIDEIARLEARQDELLDQL